MGHYMNSDKKTINRHDIVIGYFNPIRVETLKPESLIHIAKMIEFTAGWLIDEDDGGPYVGQFALCPLRVITLQERTTSKIYDQSPSINMGWVPEEDVTILEVIPLD